VAKLYAESELCRREVYRGEGSVPYVCPGFTFALEDHYRGDFNREYLTLDVEHEGNQTGYLLAGLTREGEPREIYYRNSFAAIPSAAQFRPERSTPRPRIAGMIPAKIDASGSGRYAELDNMGRYKVILPFDTSGRKDGKASAWVRMASPYAGADHGMHFPLHKGTEVLLTFMDGNPDRPVIAAAAPNPETPSVVNADDETMAKITTAGGNSIHIEDRGGSERILMHAPKQQSFIRIGAPNDPAVDDGYAVSDWGIAERSKGYFDVEAKFVNSVILGNSLDIVMGGRAYVTVGLSNDTVVGGTLDLHAPEKWTWSPFTATEEMNSLEAVDQEIITAIFNRCYTAAGEEFKANVAQAINSMLKGVLKQAKAGASNARAVKQRTEAAQNKVDVHGQKIDAIKNKFSAVTMALSDVATEIETSSQKFSAYGTFIKNRGTDINSIKAAFTTAGTTIEQAGVIMEGL
jgi:type VI secretion system secreted protein VgrG